MTEIDQPEALDRRVDEIGNRWPAVGLAVGIIRNGVLESFSGRGVDRHRLGVARDPGHGLSDRLHHQGPSPPSPCCSWLEQGRIDLEGPRPTTTSARTG